MVQPELNFIIFETLELENIYIGNPNYAYIKHEWCSMLTELENVCMVKLE